MAGKSGVGIAGVIDTIIQQRPIRPKPQVIIKLHRPRVVWNIFQATSLAFETQDFGARWNQTGGENAAPFLLCLANLQHRSAALDHHDHSRQCVPCVTAPPARNAAATITASAISASVQPAVLARLLWISMQ